MKLIRLSILFLIASLTFTACSSDDPKEDYGELREDMAMMRVQGRIIKSIVTDDNVELNIGTDWKVDSIFARPDTTYRVILQYGYKENVPVTLYSLQRVPVYSPAKLHDATGAPDRDALTVKDDPLQAQSMWLSTNGKYLNLFFYVRNSSNELSKHIFDVTEDSVAVMSNGLMRHYIKMRHDRGSAMEYYSVPFFASVPLDAYRPGEEIVARIKDYDGLVMEKTFTVK